MAWSLCPLSSSGQWVQQGGCLAWGKLTPTRQGRGVAVWLSKGVVPLLSLASPPALGGPRLPATDNALNAQSCQEKAGQGRGSFPRFWCPLTMHKWIRPCCTSWAANPAERTLKTTVAVGIRVVALQGWVFSERGFFFPFPHLCNGSPKATQTHVPLRACSGPGGLMDTASWFGHRAGAAQVCQRLGLLSTTFLHLCLSRSPVFLPVTMGLTHSVYIPPHGYPVSQAGVAPFGMPAPLDRHFPKYENRKLAKEKKKKGYRRKRSKIAIRKCYFKQKDNIISSGGGKKWNNL